jgi:hypothetical protein
MHWLGDVLEGPGTPIFNIERNLTAGVVEDSPGNADAAWLSQSFEPRGDIHSITVKIIAVDYDVAQIDANPQLDTLIGGYAGIARTHPLLQLDSAAHRIYHAGKFDQQPITGRFHDAPVVLGDFRVDQFAAVSLETSKRPLLVHSHQSAVACHIGGNDRCKLAFDALGRHGETSLPNA